MIEASVKALHEAIVGTTAKMEALHRALSGMWERCDYSWLWPNECAHCLGHEPDWEEPKKSVVYD